MKTKRDFPAVLISPKGRAFLERGHVWVYDAEIRSAPPSLANGALVDVLSENGRYLGTGIYSEKSKIRVRLLSRSANDRFDDAFFERQIRYAWEYRKTVMPNDLNACRVIFGEADRFPGLTVDRFGSILVTETLSFGIEMRKPQIFPLLLKVLQEDGQKVDGIYERNDASLRLHEGLSQNKGWYIRPENPSTDLIVTENQIAYHVDVENGQKTGFFLDQKYNRLAVSRLAKGKRVLDCFTHTGSFALNAAAGGAEHVTGLDISADAVAMAEKNAALNRLSDKVTFVKADVFAYLTAKEKEGGAPFDFIILDPPAFTKSRKTVESAYRGYKDINYRAMRLLPRGGYLATCSCSHFMEPRLFEKMLAEAARDAAVELREIEVRRAAPDHPILWGVPETAYLKFYLFQVI